MTASQRDNPRRRAWHLLALRLAVMLATLFLLSRVVDARELLKALRAASPPVILVALAMAVARTWLTGIRWRLLVPDPSNQLSSWQYFRYMMISNTFNLFMPGALGGDLARSAMVVRSVSQGRALNLFAILVDRVVGLSSIVLLGIAACLFAPSMPERSSYLAMLAVVGLLFFGGVAVATATWTNHLLRRLAERLGRFSANVVRLLDAWSQARAFYRDNPGRLVAGLAICLPIHASWLLVVYLLARSLGIDISFSAIATVTVLVWVITAVPVSFGGVGVRELSYVYLLSLQGVPNAQGVALSLYCFLIFVLLALLGLPFLFAGRGAPTADAKSPTATESGAEPRALESADL